MFQDWRRSVCNITQEPPSVYDDSILTDVLLFSDQAM